MTNEELKKKIIEIIINAIWKDAKADYDSTDETEARSIADALIAAGIGDVSELKKHRVVVEKSLIPEDDNAYVLPNIPLKVKQLYSGEEVEKIVKERDEYKHRAEVAERALLRACKINAIFAEADAPNILAESALYRFYLQQAEKELAEERKDD